MSQYAMNHSQSRFRHVADFVRAPDRIVRLSIGTNGTPYLVLTRFEMQASGRWFPNRGVAIKAHEVPDLERAIAEFKTLLAAHAAQTTEAAPNAAKDSNR